jgi:hypothetical protein
MQLKKRKRLRAMRNVGAPLAAATCALLGQTPRTAQPQELGPWSVDTSLLIYSESDGRVQDLSLNGIAKKELREESFLDLTFALDALTGAGAGGRGGAKGGEKVCRAGGKPE